MRIHGLDYAGGRRGLKTRRGVQASAAVKQKDIRLARGSFGHSVEQDFAEVGQLIAHRSGQAQPHASQIEILHMIRADQPVTQLGQRSPRAETREAADKRAQASGLRQRRGVGVVVRAVGGGIGDEHAVRLR